jgi:putative transposase
MTKLRHYDNLGTARFVTFSCYNRYSLLTNEADIRIFFKELDSARRRFDFALHGFVLMPSHVHLVLHPRKEMKLGTVIGEVKSLSARAILARWREADASTLQRLCIVRRGEERLVFWHSKCYDHNCRTTESVIEKITYCHLNPVRAGLVTDPKEWEWSSYRWYVGQENSILSLDGLIS